MSKKVELEMREIFGYALVIFGIVLLVYTFMQAAITINNIMTFVGKLMPNPTTSLYREALETTEMPGFAEGLMWFFMLVIQTLIGFGIASLGVTIAKKS